ncbi:MAG: GIY-YIG nuclease family protein [Porphyromonadaceae bacterium]|jgi:hypothetical protein|nr:GIY-YIG nuclease family protein [Porphyromonadaceae bacterium]
MAKTLDEIFDSDDLGLLEVKAKVNPIKTDEDRLIDTFLEITAFVEKNGREPNNSSMAEYGLLSKLKSIRENEKHKILLKPFDKHNLLGEVKIEIKSIDDILREDTLGLLNSESDASLYNFKHTPRQTDKREEADFIAQRKPLSDKEFEKYEILFQQVHRELKDGKRRLIAFKDAEKNLIEGNFYLVDGLLCYLESSNAEKILKQNKSGDRVRLEGRTVTIFENGTKSNMLFRSLGKAILKNGKMVTNPYTSAGNELLSNMGIVSEPDVESGWIYVLRSKQKKLKDIPNLFKIGFSVNKVEDRIKNAEQEATFLYAGVEVVSTYRCFNVNTHNFENLLHRFFGNVCLNVDVFNKQNQRITPREWFIVPLEIVDEAINMIINGSIVNFRYDEKTQKIVLK